MRDIADSEINALNHLLVPHSSQHMAQSVMRQTGVRVSVRSIDGWKAGRSLPRVELLDALAVAIDVPIREMREAYTRSRIARRQRRSLARDVSAVRQQPESLRRAS